MRKSTKVLQVKGIFKDFKGRSVIRGVDFVVKKGEIFGLFGPNGAGKTVLFGMVIGLILPDSGEIKVFGKSLEKNLTHIRSRINFAASYTRLYGAVDVTTNLITYAKLYSVVNREKKISELIRFFGLEDLAQSRRQVRDFSTGEAIRLLLAKAMLNDPQLILLDEPTVHLDPQMNQKFRNLLKKLNKEKKLTIFYISHNLQEAEEFCSRVAFLRKGKIVAINSIDRLKKQHQAESTQALYAKLMKKGGPE